MSLSPDQMAETVRRGFLFDHLGHPWRVPPELFDLYREHYPELGTARAAVEDLVKADPDLLSPLWPK